MIKMFELHNQIESITEEVVSSFLDAWECQSWGVSCTKFAELLIANIRESLTQAIAYEIDNTDEEYNNN